MIRAGTVINRSDLEKKRRREWDVEAGDDEDNDERRSCEGGDDDNEDGLLYEGDSDSETDDDFTTRYKVVERALWDTANSPMAQEDDGQRNCLNHPLVNSRIYGEITKPASEYWDYNPVPIHYYSASHKIADTIDIDPYALLPLSGAEPRPPVCEETGVYMYFAFKINDEDILVDFQDEDHVNRDLFPCDGVSKCCDITVGVTDQSLLDKYGPCILRCVVGDPSTSPILMMAYTSRYRGAWATIDVKMLDEGVKGVSGLIAARPCILYSRIRLLSLKRRDEDKTVMIQRSEDGLVGNDGSIKLTRSLVAVPSNSSLIIGAVLYDRENGDNLICSGRTFFPAMEMGEETKIIFYDGVPALKVTARWKCSETV